MKKTAATKTKPTPTDDTIEFVVRDRIGRELYRSTDLIRARHWIRDMNAVTPDGRGPGFDIVDANDPRRVFSVASRAQQLKSQITPRAWATFLVPATTIENLNAEARRKNLDLGVVVEIAIRAERQPLTTEAGEVPLEKLRVAIAKPTRDRLERAAAQIGSTVGDLGASVLRGYVEQMVRKAA